MNMSMGSGAYDQQLIKRKGGEMLIKRGERDTFEKANPHYLQSIAQAKRYYCNLESWYTNQMNPFRKLTLNKRGNNTHPVRDSYRDMLDG